MSERIAWVEDPAWSVGPIKDYELLFNNLSGIIPEDAVLFIEGTGIAQEIKDFLSSKAIEAPQDIKVGEGPDLEDLPPERTYKVPIIGGELRIFPKSDTFHVPATHDNFLQIAKMSKHHAKPEMFDSLIVYKERTALLSWYDAFFSSPFHLSTQVSEVKLKEFCAKVNVKYKLKN